MESLHKIKPLSLARNVVYCLIPALVLYATHYYLIPGWVEASGAPYLVGYLIGYIATMGLFLVAALVAYRREGHPFTREAFQARYRLRRMGWVDWLLVAVTIVFALLTYFGLGSTGEWVWSVPLLEPREAWPAEFGPGGIANIASGQAMGMPLYGRWELVLAYFVGWLFNILGEELWFRGYLLPRQEAAIGSAAWVANGLTFAINHLWQPWIIITILPSSLLLAYVVQRRRNTLIGIVQHGVMNIGLLFVLIGGVVGMP